MTKLVHVCSVCGVEYPDGNNLCHPSAIVESVVQRGGRRAGAGRKPDAGERRTELARVPLTSGELAELLDASGDQPLAQYLREAGLAMARTR